MLLCAFDIGDGQLRHWPANRVHFLFCAHRALLCSPLCNKTAHASNVAEMLETGLYQSQNEILREGLRLLKEREDSKKLRFAALRKEIVLGARQADRGEFVDGPQTFAKIRRKSAQQKRTRG